MKVIIAPDSFKGSSSSADACCIIKRRILDICPKADVICIPIADGGEGTLDALVDSNSRKQMTVTGPLGDKICARYGHIGKTAIVEMAAAAGLTLVPSKNRSAANTTTYGVGELIADAIDNGFRKIMLTAGGSATNDGGCGMMAALGVSFFDKNGTPFVPTGGTLADIAKIDVSGIKPELYRCEITIATDVKNPLLGQYGATCVYAPQKGANADELTQMEQGMVHYAALLKDISEKEVSSVEGCGAGGGIAAPLVAVLNASIRSGIDTVLDSADFDAALKNADIVITGEGKIDRQSLFGKAISGVTKRANAGGVPVYCFVGGIGDDKEQLLSMGIADIYAISSLARSLSDAMENASKYLDIITEQFVEEVINHEK